MTTSRVIDNSIFNPIQSIARVVDGLGQDGNLAAWYVARRILLGCLRDP
jgi:hypothetical protein